MKSMMTPIRKNLIQYYPNYHRITEYTASLHTVLALIARIYVAKIFFMSGLTKIQDWDTTLFLFEEEYQVPFLPADLAAYLGTAGELIFPILLLIGMASRFSALALSVVNIVAVVSLADIAPAALYLHIIWGMLLTYVVLYGAGTLSLDRWIKHALLK